MKAFKLLKGMHEQNGHVFHSGEVVHTQLDLVKLFPCKFEEVVVVSSHQSPPPVNSGRVNTNDPNPNSGDGGIDVTDKFPLAGKLGVLVHKYPDGTCKVLDAEDKDVLNGDTVLKTKKQVDSFLASLKAPDEDLV
jgi:hypothetical protein